VRRHLPVVFSREFDTLPRRDIINLKRAADRKLRADRLLTLTSLGKKRSTGRSRLGVESLLDRAEAGCYRHALDFTGTHTREAKAVDELKVVRDGGGTIEARGIRLLPILLPSLIACGMCAFGEYNDHIPSFGGGWQLPFMFPPTTSAIEGPGKIGQVHWASSNSVVVPLTAIFLPSGVQVEAAQSAKSPRQILNSCCTGSLCASAVPNEAATIKPTTNRKAMSQDTFTVSPLLLGQT
jgi:hypothetical protein